MEATGVLPFVRGVDLSGNDFKVRRPGGGAGPLYAVSSAPARTGLRFLSRPPPGPVPLGTAGGAGWGSPGARVPRPERIPKISFRCPYGKTEAGSGGVDPWVRSHARDGLRAPTPCHRPGIWAPPGPESGAGSLSSAPTSPAPLPRPAEVTRPSQALTHCRAAGCCAVPGRVWNSSQPLLCPCHRHSHPVWSWANHFLSQSLGLLIP